MTDSPLHHRFLKVTAYRGMALSVLRAAKRAFIFLVLFVLCQVVLMPKVVFDVVMDVECVLEKAGANLLR